MRLRRVEPVLRRALLGPCRVAAGARVLVALSGGADSTALLVALASIAPERELELHAAHLNHRLRGADSDADAAFVAALCKRLRVPLVTARWGTRARMRHRGISGENGLRTLRREFLDGAATRVDAGCIATAHTADDQLETLLLRLMRGTGLRGLGGMRPRAGHWIKPLLELTRAELEADLRGARQPWREDASNADPAFARNRVRHGVVPALLAAMDTPGSRAARTKPAARRAALAPDANASVASARSALARRVAALATELREAETALRRWTRGLARTATGNTREVRIPLARLRRFPVAARRELFRAVWRQVAPADDGLTAAHLVQIDRLQAGAGGPVRLPSGFAAWRDGAALLIAPGRIQEDVHTGAGSAGNPAGPGRKGRLRRAGAARRDVSVTEPAALVGRDFRKR